ncbi:MAG TPA: tetratricopeptide repeat protein [Anaeromyxobacter sp.]
MNAPRSALRAALLIVPLLSSAAAEPSTYRCEARGGSAWREYRTRHFVVATDLSAGRAEAVVRDLERLHALVVQALVGEQAEIPGKVRVVAFADPADFRRMGREPFEAYFRIDWLSRPTIVFAVDGFQENAEVVAQSLAFHVSWYLFPRQPHWFTIGLGLFVQTVASTREETTAKIGTRIVRGGRETGGNWAGLAPAGAVKYLRRAGGGMPEDILTWSSWTDDVHQEVVDRYYSWSWLLYHWLWNTRPKAFTDFTNRLANAEDPAAAWRACFPDLDPAKPGGTRALSEALEAYQRDGRFAAYQVKAPREAQFSAAPLSSAEVHMLLLDARSRRTERASIDAEVAEAAREDPLHPQALWNTAREEDRRAAMRRAAEARPDDWRGWYLLSLTLKPDEERTEKEAALRKAVALDPDSAVARNGLAWLLYQSGRPKEAIVHANAAVDLAPWHPPAVDTLAAVAAALGKCKDAAILEHRAIDLVRDSERARYQKRLEDIESRCAAPPAK